MESKPWQASLSRSLVNENKWESILKIFNVDWKRTVLINKHFRVLWISTGRNDMKCDEKMRNEKSFSEKKWNWIEMKFFELINYREEILRHKSTNPSVKNCFWSDTRVEKEDNEEKCHISISSLFFNDGVELLVENRQRQRNDKVFIIIFHVFPDFLKTSNW